MSVVLGERPLIATEFSEWLNARMEERGIDTSHLAAYTGLPYMTVQRWQKGKTPKSENCYKIAEALGRDPREVLARAGHLKLDTAQLKVLELDAKLDRLGGQVLALHDEIRQTREEVGRWREEHPELPE